MIDKVVAGLAPRATENQELHAGIVAAAEEAKRLMLVELNAPNANQEPSQMQLQAAAACVQQGATAVTAKRKTR